MEHALKLRTTALNHYKREDIQKAMVETCRHREVAVRMGDNGFGKRPDIVTYPKDILELAKNGTSSFHVSEERWSNPLQLRPQMPKKELDELRVGWDFILDIDSPHWEISKLITSLLVSALRKHNIKSVSCKFSGNKGFHIAVPFEAFPLKTDDIETRLKFPDSLRKIAFYLIDYIDSKKNNFEFSRLVRKIHSIEELLSMTGLAYGDLIVKICSECETIIPKVKQKKKEGYINCPFCKTGNDTTSDYIVCKHCKKLFRPGSHEEAQLINCPKCSSNKETLKINPTALIDVDTVLISSRHLYRMVYSLHEKSLLVSVPINPDEVMKFTKEMAATGRRLSRFKFMDTSDIKIDEAKDLFDKAHTTSREKEESEKRNLKFKTFYYEKSNQDYEEVADAINPEYFPPCIKCALNGLPDGRKRFLFLFINFLRSVGWGKEEVEKLLNEWNEKNTEALREVEIKGQIRYQFARKDKILPPNCSNEGYYKDFQICKPDSLCAHIKNPVNYAKLKAKSGKNDKSKPGKDDGLKEGKDDKPKQIKDDEPKPGDDDESKSGKGDNSELNDKSSEYDKPKEE